MINYKIISCFNTCQQRTPKRSKGKHKKSCQKRMRAVSSRSQTDFFLLGRITSGCGLCAWTTSRGARLRPCSNVSDCPPSAAISPQTPSHFPPPFSLRRIMRDFALLRFALSSLSRSTIISFSLSLLSPLLFLSNTPALSYLKFPPPFSFCHVNLHARARANTHTHTSSITLSIYHIYRPIYIYCVYTPLHPQHKHSQICTHIQTNHWRRRT